MATTAENRCQVCDLTVFIDNDAAISSKMGENHGQTPIVACQACRKFFLRNRNKNIQALRCLSGTNSCSIDKTTATPIGSGVLWRMACPRCRLAKCFAIGLAETARRQNHSGAARHSIAECQQQEHHDEKEEEPEEMKRTSIAAVANRESSVAEKMINDLIQATNQLSLDFEETPLVKTEKSFQNEIEAWANLMLQHSYINQSIVKLANSMAGFDKLTQAEQQTVLATAGSSLALAESNRFNTNPCNMTLKNATGLFKFFPEFEFTVPFCKTFREMMDTWKPNSVEFSCLLALLLFQKFYGNGDSTNSGTQEIGLVIHSALMQLSNGDGEKFKMRLENLLATAKLFQTAATYRTAALTEALRRRPYLLPATSPMSNNQ